MNSMDVAMRMVKLGVLEVRSDGTVWKCRNLNAMPLLAPRRVETRAKAGYLLVRVHFESKPYLVSAHRLVWTALRGPIPSGQEPNHKDGNKHNNHPDNLELMTRGQNHEHAWRTGLRRRSNMPGSVAAAAALLRAQGHSYSEIAAALNVSTTTAHRAVRSVSAASSDGTPE